MLQPGDTIGPYVLIQILGRGAFGEVWRAERVSSLLTTQVALKLPLDAATALETIRQEAQVWLKASGHPNVVPVLDAEVYDGQVVIASEYVAGGSLADWLARHGGKAPSIEDAVKMVAGVLAGLGHLHSNDLIHRDLKPGNILLQSSLPRLTDFGLSRILKPTGHTSSVGGTPGYMAPEAFQGHYSPASDLWAAGILLHELLAGALPYPQTDFYPLVLAITSDAPVTLSPQVPEELRPFLSRALSKPHRQRFASAVEMAEALTSPSAPFLHFPASLEPGGGRSASKLPGSLPTGTVSFLFTDVEGSTRFWERNPDSMRLAVARHAQLLREAIENHNGYVFKTVGDAFCAAFPTAADALRTAVESNLGLQNMDWGEAGPLRVRMAVHTGMAEERDHDYFGPTLNRAARLLALAHGRQTLISQAACELIRDVLPAGVTLRDLGIHRLKDLSSPEHVWQMFHPALPEAFPPLKSLDYLPTNLPAQMTSFIGRDKEMADVRALLNSSRLLTLTGSGGTGKSRLSLQVAAGALDDYEDGVWLVELASLADPALVPHALAAALHIREQPGKPIARTVVEGLASKSLLLILDNCEHVLDAAAALTDAILRGCPGVKILASSREGLGVAGERTYRVPSLSLPPEPSAARKLPLETIREYESVRLFAERAAMVSDGFTITPENAPAVARLCFRLDGIPLALELAAARVRSLPVAQIEARLHDRFRLLTGGSRTALPRQQTLRALMDWSYDLLNGQEKTLLRRLSVFAGGWDMEAAEALCAGGTEVPGGGDTSDSIEAWKVLDLLTALVDKSLVAYEEQAGAARYRLLETVRQYARERLSEGSEGRIFRDLHRDYYLALAEEARPQLVGARQAHWLNRLEREHENLRAALDYCREDPAGGEAGLRLGAALQQFWWTRGYLAEGRERLAALLARPEARERTAARAGALNGAGVLAWFLGDRAAARTSHEESLPIARELHDLPCIARSLGNLGILAKDLGEYRAARAYYAEALALYRTLQDKPRIAQSLGNLGIVVKDMGDYAAAGALYEECLSMMQETGNKGGIAFSLSNLANIALIEGETARAQSLDEQALTLHRELGDLHGAAFILGSLANIARSQGQLDHARALHEESLALKREIGEPQGIAHSLHGLGQVASEQKTYDEAEALFVESLALCRELGGKLQIAVVLEDMAELEHARRRHARAATLLAASEALRQALEAPVPPQQQERHAQRNEEMEAQLGKEACTRANAAGRAMDFDQAIAFAVSAENGILSADDADERR